MAEYQIDQQNGMVSYLDERTQAIQTERIDELFELLFWLRNREPDLRKMLYDFAPISLREMMRPVGDFFIGQTKDRFLCRVSIDDYQAEMVLVEQRVRQQWADARNEKYDHLTHWDNIFGVERTPQPHLTFAGDPIPAILLAPDELRRVDPAECPYQDVWEETEKQIGRAHV